MNALAHYTADATFPFDDKKMLKIPCTMLIDRCVSVVIISSSSFSHR